MTGAGSGCWERLRFKSEWMTAIFGSLILFAGLWFFWGCDGSDGGSGGRCGAISGRVTLDGRGVRGATVSLTGDGTEMSTITNLFGAYAFDGVPKGSYRATLTPPEGYVGKPGRPVEKTLDVQNLGHVDFAMRSDTIKTIDSGTIIGTREENGIAVWYGLPFAKPPVDGLRWKAPRAEDAWEDTYMAVTPCQPCTQFANMLLSSPGYDETEILGGEDCLYLNVWAPEAAGDGPKPVMFWVHGGANAIGEGISYSGKMLAEKYGVVVVTINYRLGPFGWFAHPALRGKGTSAEDRSGNFGTLDIIRALKWVQANIAAFGGDRDNVTLFGESAGAFNTLTLLASPLAEGLFHRAIAQSPVIDWIAEHSNWQPMSVAENYMDDPEPGNHFSSRETIDNLLIADGLAEDRAAAKALQASMSDTQIERYLRAMAPEKLLSVYSTKWGGMIIMPTAIQDGLVIPSKDALSVFQAGEFHHVPVMIGSNRDEMRFFLMLDPAYTLNIMDAIPVVLKPNTYELAARYLSDAWKATAVDEIAAAMSRHQPDDVYVYRFDWDDEPNILGTDLSFIVGAAHGMEIPSVFADPDMVLMDAMAFTQTPANREGREVLAETLSSYWAAMACNGAPGTGMAQAPLVAAWTPWTDRAGKKNLMVLDAPSDAGVRMENFHLSSDEIKIRLQNETGFRKEADHCDVYYAIFGTDDYYQRNCSE